MLFGFDYLCKFIFYFSLFKKKNAENNRLKKASWPQFCNIIFLFLLQIGSVKPVDQQINLVSPNKIVTSFTSRFYAFISHLSQPLDVQGGPSGYTKRFVEGIFIEWYTDTQSK